MAALGQVDVRVGLDVGKSEHFADVLDNGGERLSARPGSIDQLALGVAVRRGVPVPYGPGLVMRRAADLYPGATAAPVTA